VPNALSKKPKSMVASLLTTNSQLLRELEALSVEVVLPADQYQLAALKVTSPVVDKIKECQKDDPKLMKFLKKAKEGKCQDFLLKDGVLWFRNRLCVPNIPKLKELLKGSHDSTLVTHPRSTKMYQDLS